MAISSYLKRCGYQQNELKNVLYLIPKSATKKVHIDGDEAYVEYSGDTSSIIKIKGNNLSFQEDTSFDDRFRFDKTITLTVDGYITFKDFYSKYYAIVEDKSGTFWMVNADFPSYITYTYTLNDGENKTDLVFYAASNIPTIKLANFNPDNAEECETYMPYGIENLKLLEKDKTKLSTHSKYIIAYDDFYKIEAIDGTYELTEEFNGETYSTQLSFSIPLSDYQSSWHVKLLEFEKNKYRGYLTLKNSDYKTLLGYNTGLFPSYVINGDIVTITLTESSNYGMIFDDVYYVLETIYRWTRTNETSCEEVVDTMWRASGTTCAGEHGVDKYNANVLYASYGSGYYPTKIVSATTLIQPNSPECGYVERTVSTGYTCVGYDKYSINEFQVSYDSGATWNTVSSTTGSLIEHYSVDCGYALPKFKLNLDNLDIVSAACDSTSAITSGEVSTQYSGSVVSANIGNCVTTIDVNAFSDCDKLTSVTISNTVKTIGEKAFFSCSYITSIDIPYGVTTIGKSAFQWCDSLSSVTIPNSLTSIGENNFAGCSGLTSIGPIGSGASIEIPSSVTNIDDKAFWNCSSLTSVTIPNSVTSIGKGVFESCFSLSSVTIPDSVEYIGDSAFTFCRSLKRINSNINGLYIIPSGITRIEKHVFQGCTNLSSLGIPNSITSIDDFAFDDCKNLTSVTIPNSVTSIGYASFGGCTGLTSIYFLSNVPPAIESNSFVSGAVNCPMYVPCGKIADYIKANNYWDFIGRLQEHSICGSPTGTKYTLYFRNSSPVSASCDLTYSVTSDDISAQYSGSVRSAVIGDCVVGIGRGTFYDCQLLSSCTIGNSVSCIAPETFFRCRSLKELTIYATTPPSLGFDAFYGTSSTMVIYVPANSVSSYQSAWPSLSSRIQAIQ